MITYKSKISFEDYNNLRMLVGWNTITKRQFDNAMKNSSFFTVAYDGDKAVGMSRGVGDGGYHLMLVDVIVHPDYQGQGIGREVVSQFMKYADDSIESGEGISLTLLSAYGKEKFYEKFGFHIRPVGKEGAGMNLKYVKK
ncbi:MAG: GNAT family N-acetyltransferase [Oscillospiraceae bacterium]